MRPTRTLIVDDEPAARNALRHLLADEPAIDMIGECRNGRDAVEWIRARKPELVFLDIQMPFLDGFGVLRELKPEELPVIVFVTAYDKYALRAFEVHALDYLLKPFSAERLKSALAHARAQLAQRRATTIGRELLDLIPEIRRPSPGRDRLVVRSSGRIYFVRTSEIDWCEAAGNYVR